MGRRRPHCTALCKSGIRLYVYGMTGGIDPFSPSSHASGRPAGQYAWLPSTFTSGPKHIRVRHGRT